MQCRCADRQENRNLLVVLDPLPTFLVCTEVGTNPNPILDPVTYVLVRFGCGIPVAKDTGGM